ncbi:MAG: hypothetical protein LBU88_00035 [Treponema sp.]|jgi:hypothetical protein|nr:hypothetical protein [Treponema sp.]
MAKRVSFVLLIVALGIFGCDFFNNPLSEYIDNATNSAEGLRAVVITLHNEMPGGVIAIPPGGGGGGKTLTHKPLRKGQG